MPMYIVDLLYLHDTLLITLKNRCDGKSHLHQYYSTTLKCLLWILTIHGHWWCPKSKAHNNRMHHSLFPQQFVCQFSNTLCQFINTAVRLSTINCVDVDSATTTRNSRISCSVKPVFMQSSGEVPAVLSPVSPARHTLPSQLTLPSKLTLPVGPGLLCQHNFEHNHIACIIMCYNHYS